MKALLLSAIGFYQRHISARKGYSCAHRVVHGGQGCSGHGYRVIERHGVRLGILLLRRRFDACSAALRTLQRPVNRQAGECDIGVPFDCDCGHGGGRACSAAGDVLECTCGVADCWPGRKNRGDMAVDPKLKARYKSNQGTRRWWQWWS